MSEHVNFIITIAGGLIIILIGIIGFLYKTNQSRFEDEEAEIKRLVQSLAETVISLDKVMIEIKINVKSQIDICSIRHDVFSKRITETEKGMLKNGVDIKEMGIEITKIKSRIK